MPWETHTHTTLTSDDEVVAVEDKVVAVEDEASVGDGSDKGEGVDVVTWSRDDVAKVDDEVTKEDDETIEEDDIWGEGITVEEESSTIWEEGVIIREEEITDWEGDAIITEEVDMTADDNTVTFIDKDWVMIKVAVMEGEGAIIESDCRSPPLPEPLPDPLPLPMTIALWAWERVTQCRAKQSHKTTCSFNIFNYRENRAHKTLFDADFMYRMTNHTPKVH